MAEILRDNGGKNCGAETKPPPLANTVSLRLQHAPRRKGPGGTGVGAAGGSERLVYGTPVCEAREGRHARRHGPSRAGGRRRPGLRCLKHVHAQCLQTVLG